MVEEIIDITRDVNPHDIVKRVLDRERVKFSGFSVNVSLPEVEIDEELSTHDAISVLLQHNAELYDLFD